jgi:tRNA U34 5-methylaminomethyl-2-thiouridine-forming methyltransferase MnmC
LKREIIKTLDGSTSIHIPEWNESYHSRHGAIQEAYHVFINNGLSLFGALPVSILEIGFGTGLNAFITFIESANRTQQISYTGIEAFPVMSDEIIEMNYVAQLNARPYESIFTEMHDCEWEQPVKLSECFTLTKRKMLIEQVQFEGQYDLIYFDAFGYGVQPELWSTEIFAKMYIALKPDGWLVTYAARGVVKRSMIEVGFTVEKLAGPPGKREMFRARKQSREALTKTM